MQIDLRPSPTDEVLDFLANSPSWDDILNFQASPSVQLRVRQLLDGNRNNSLTPEEEAELDEFDKVNDVLGLLKIRVRKILAEKA